jgi:Ran GTPase-activating protein (RanGAP) involved in mRNA processing and transport
MYYVAKVDGIKKWDTSSQISSVLQFLQDNADKITGIELSGNSIGFDVAKELAQFIEKLTNLDVILPIFRLLTSETSS